MRILLAVAIASVGAVVTLEAQPNQIQLREVVRIGSADGPDAFGRVVGALRLPDGSIVVADQHARQLTLFSSDGALVRSIGGPGSGPGEFRTIMSIGQCLPGEIFVYDPALMRISTFSSDGDLARSLDLRGKLGRDVPPYEFFCGPDQTMVFLHRSTDPPAGVGPRRPIVDVTLHRPDGQEASLGRLPGPERYFDGSQDIPRPLGKETSAAILEHRILVGTGDRAGPDEAELRVFDKRGEERPPLRFPSATKSVSQSFLETYIENRVSDRRSGYPEAAARRYYQDIVFPEAFPPYSRVIAGGEDVVWIEDYPAGSSRRWQRLHLDGADEAHQDGVLELAGDRRLLSADPAGLVFVREDQLGVEFVEVYAFR